MHLIPKSPDPLAETQRDRTIARAVDRVREKYGAKGILPAALVRENND